MMSPISMWTSSSWENRLSLGVHGELTVDFAWMGFRRFSESGVSPLLTKPVDEGLPLARIHEALADRSA